MGALVYGPGLLRVDVDDDLLAHLQVVITAKLRRHEGFVLTLGSVESQTHSIWLNDAIPLIFEYESGERRSIERRVIDSMMIESVKPDGLRVEVSEPERRQLSIVD